MCDVAGRGRECSTGAIRQRRDRIDPFGDDSGIPRAGQQDLLGLGVRAREQQLIDNDPRRRERQSIASRQSVATVGVRVLVVRRMQPLKVRLKSGSSSARKPRIGSFSRDPAVCGQPGPSGCGGKGIEYSTSRDPRLENPSLYSRDQCLDDPLRPSYRSFRCSAGKLATSRSIPRAPSAVDRLSSDSRVCNANSQRLES